MRPLPISLIVCVLCLGAAAPAAAADDTHISLFEMFFLSGDAIGLIIIWFLLALSALSVGFTIKMAIGYRRPLLLPDQTRSELNALISEKKYRDAIEFAGADTSYLGKVTNAALTEAANGYTAMERAVEESSEAETARLLRPLEYLNVVGNIAPMLGLFGTVYGMIVAFQQLVESQGQADPQKLAAGISTALVTTFWGLVVAIPALAAYALIRNKVDALTSEGILMVENIITPFKPSGKKGNEKRPRAVPKPE